MSIKYICDVCEKPMPEKETDRLKLEFGEIKLEVMVAFRGVCNAGHICHACIRKVLVEGKPRKKTPFSRED